MDLNELTAVELNKLLLSGKAGFEEAVLSYIEKINKDDKHINSYISKSFETAISKSRELQKKQKAGEQLSTLAGVPFAVKDNMCVKDEKTTCASKILSNYISPYTATAVGKLIDKDAIYLGKLNMDEFAMGSSSETSYFGPVRNPWDLKRVPGGSSGGSAAAAAAGLACFTLGSDTGGSIRQPASFCGVIGLKPSYGRVSRYGLIAFASSLDQIGPITRDVTDSAKVLETICGFDKYDATSLSKPSIDLSKKSKNSLEGMRIAVFEEFLSDRIDNDVKTIINKAYDILSDLGAKIELVKFPLLEYAIPVYYIISSAEASSNLSRFDGIKYGKRTDEYHSLLDIYIKSRSEGFGEEVKRRIMLGTYALSSGYYDAYYLKAVKVRNLIKDSLDKIFNMYDVVAGPVAPSSAFMIGEKTGDPLSMYLGDIFTVIANISGNPAISIPAGFDKKQMPVGLQIMGRSFGEEEILSVAHAFSEQTKELYKIPKIDQENQN